MMRILLLVILAVFAAPTAVQGGGPETRMVDDDGRAEIGDCDSDRAAVRRVQDAVDASGPGDTVLVCPGTYRGALITTDDLVLRSVEPWGATLRPFIFVGGNKEPRQHALAIWGARRVRLVGFTISSARGTKLGCRPISLVDLLGSTGWLLGNRIVAGRERHGACTRYGAGIFAYLTPWWSIRGNFIQDFDSAGMVVVGDRDEGRVTSATLTANIIQRLRPSPRPDRGKGIGVFGSLPQDTVVVVEDNVILGVPGAPLEAGLWTDLGDVRARRNVIDGARVAIDLERGTGVVERNALADGWTGIRVRDAAYKISANSATDFRRHGIKILGVGGNAIYQNDFRGNGSVDCVDRTTGEGTAGTANIWRRNLGDESTPNGICWPGL